TGVFRIIQMLSGFIDVNFFSKGNFLQVFSFMYDIGKPAQLKSLHICCEKVFDSGIFIFSVSDSTQHPFVIIPEFHFTKEGVIVCFNNIPLHKSTVMLRTLTKRNVISSDEECNKK